MTKIMQVGVFITCFPQPATTTKIVCCPNKQCDWFEKINLSLGKYCQDCGSLIDYEYTKHVKSTMNIDTGYVHSSLGKKLKLVRPVSDSTKHIWVANKYGESYSKEFLNFELNEDNHIIDLSEIDGDEFCYAFKIEFVDQIKKLKELYYTSNVKICFGFITCA